MPKGKIENRQHKPTKKPTQQLDEQLMMVDSVNMFLRNWKQPSRPNPKFWKELLGIMQPDKPSLVKAQVTVVLEDFSRILSKQLEFFNPYPIGSRITGLAFCDSDIDILVETKVSRKQKIQLMSDITQILRQQPNDWRQVTPIVTAKIFLIKATHRSTGRQCDFSFNDRLFSLYNTQLISHLVSSNEQIKALTMLLKCWLRINGIAGTNQFTSYHLILMILFYLQVIPSPILPPLNHFQSKVQPHAADSAWNNVAIDNNSKFPTTNRSSVLSLLYGFFKYYNTFDFANSLICPLTGRIHNRDGLLNDPLLMATVLPGFFLQRNAKHELLIANHRMYVQDPIRPNVNVAKSCTNASFVAFKQKLAMICCLIQNAPPKNLEQVCLLAEVFAMHSVAIKRKKVKRPPLMAEMVPSKLELAKVTMDGNPTSDILAQRWLEQAAVFYEQILHNVTEFHVASSNLPFTNMPKNETKVLRRLIVTLTSSMISPAKPCAGGTEIKRKLLNQFKKFLANENQAHVHQLQFQITLTATKQSTLVVRIDRPRCGTLKICDEAHPIFHGITEFLLKSDGARAIMDKLFTLSS